jgi:hypothetical protein
MVMTEDAKRFLESLFLGTECSERTRERINTAEALWQMVTALRDIADTQHFAAALVSASATEAQRQRANVIHDHYMMMRESTRLQAMDRNWPR